jgi:SAM-dependent methyltransferase
MSIIGGQSAYWLLKTFFSRKRSAVEGPLPGKSNYYARLTTIVGDASWEQMSSARILDFGCGHGAGIMDLSRRGATRLIGFDNRPEVLEIARQRAVKADLDTRCQFISELPAQECAEFVISIDAFEHFDDPASVLSTMARLLVRGGRVIASFGPTWYHPRGGHLFSPFPWAHLLVSEAALCRWRRDFRDDGAQRFGEVEGGLNQFSIASFERIFRNSDLQLEKFITRPIRGTELFYNRINREFLTSIVDVVLVKP